MKKLIATILVATTASFLSSCSPPAPVHVHEVNVVKLPTKTAKRTVYVKPKATAESFRAVSH